MANCRYILHVENGIYFIRLRLTMPKLFDPKVEGMVLAFSTAGLTSWEIVKVNNISVYQRSVFNIIKNKGTKREAKSKGLKSPKKLNTRITVTPRVIQKVKLLTSKENPPKKNELARQHKVSQSTIHRLIKRRHVQRFHFRRPTVGFYGEYDVNIPQRQKKTGIALFQPERSLCSKTCV
ncbi:unnamed protein product [Allacma fusca]|uniref:Uncharacterized protein n=1 Tax=Allacma fusca TaxID=39272 RepID=A0A8J2NXY2_9HEXA|nr:unnamed protein product [Allacma fusca]